MIRFLLKSLHYFLSALLFFPVIGHLKAQEIKIPAKQNRVFQQPNPMRRDDKGIRIMFYNVENLFDIKDDSLKADEEYISGGMRGWTFNRMLQKERNLSKVIMSAGGWEMPEIIGMCEVENRYVLNLLLKETPLEKFSYKIIHRESPDPRGIDVAMLYRPEKFKPLYIRPIAIKFPFDTVARTRDILYVKGVVLNRDTLHLFVNHWPSRFGGYTETVPKRNFVARVLRGKVDSIMAANPASKIVIMGDFNDEPTDESIVKQFRAVLDSTNVGQGDLYDMMVGAGTSWNRGTIKSREVWNTIDQFIVSEPLLKGTTGLSVTPHSVAIFDAPFLLQNDDAWFGQKPFRTYYGFKYIGGFSDHLPIMLDLKMK
jgi:endonuclease/exonuclease/phosphatase family metal-dependent hydrolase